ncbi:MAG: hypothetical protein HYU66_28365 [Armatimonadetes bacterium]|nr:hypothetical protein [Armatimonadota bacterium]
MNAVAAVILLLDFGTPKSPVMANWTQVVRTADGAGPWVGTPAQEAFEKVWPRSNPNASTGREDPPPVYTNDLLCDGITGAQPAALRVELPAGDYELWFAAGSPAPVRGQVFDFTVGAGAGSAGVQIQGQYWLETRRFRFHAAGGATDVAITPKSKYALLGMAIYPAAEADRVAREALDEHEKSIYQLPPDLLAKWKLLATPDPVGQMPAIPAADRARGYLVHQRSYLENIYPETVPYAAEISPTLQAFASLGEYEPLNFAVYALKDLHGCRVNVSDLRGPGVIPGAAVDVKLVQFANSRLNYTVTGSYKVVPDYLRPFDTADIPANRNQRFWLTVHVPNDAAGGMYSGEATLTAADAPAATVPIRLRVLPIRLQADPDKSYGIYYRDPLDEASRAQDDSSKAFYEHQARLQAEDMNAHGTVLNVPLSVWIGVPKDPAQPLGLSYDWTGLEARVARCRKYGYNGPFIVSLNTGGLYERHMKGERFGSHLRGAKPCPDAFVTEMQAMVAYIEAGRKERGLPEFLYYPVDEPGTTPDQVGFMVQCLQGIRAGGGKTYVTADPTHEPFDPMRPLVDVWCTQPFLPTHDVVTADMQQSGVRYWCYPNHINGENDHTTVAGARFTYGFGFWRSGFVTLIPWIYGWTVGNPFNNLDGSSADFFNRPGPDGTVWPVPMWEAYREGYDDYRYVYTCGQLIAQAKKAGKTKEAAAAQAVLDEVWRAIEVKPKYKLDSDVWGYREFDLRRWQIAREILHLQGALR